MSFFGRQKNIDAKACEWLMLTQERALNSEEQQAFSAWLAADEAHASSLQELENVWSGLGELDSLADLRRDSTDDGSVLARINSFFSFDNFQLPQMAGGFAVVLLLATVLIAPQFKSAQNQQSFETAISETLSLTLADGSKVTLGAHSQIDISFDNERRHVDLNRGQAFFEVSKDGSRPFYVATKSAVVRVVGTRFDVRRDKDEIKVSVEEGIVEVVRRSGRTFPSHSVGELPELKTLLAGQQVHVSPELMSEIMPIDSSALASWRDGRLVYHNARLSEVIADANRYYPGSIILGAQHLEYLQVTTSYSVDQVETMVSMLEQSLPLVVHRDTDGRILILPKY